MLARNFMRLCWIVRFPNGSPFVANNLFRTPHCGGLKYERERCAGSLRRRRHFGLELALVELIDDLALWLPDSGLTEALALVWRSRPGRNCGRPRDENRLSHP